MSQLLLSTLGVICPACDELNAPRAGSCAGCGGSLGAATSKPAPARAPEGGPRRSPPGPAPVPSAAPPAGAPPPRVAAAAPAARAAPSPRLPPAPPRSAAPELVPPGMRPSQRPPAGPGAPELPGPPVATDRPTPEPARRPGTAPAAGAPARFVLTVLAGANAGHRYRLAASVCHVGRTRGGILFPDDPYVSPVHAAFLVKDGKLHVRDESSASGVFIGVHHDLIPPNTRFCAGRRLFRYCGAVETPPLPLGRPIVYGAPVPPGQTVYLLEELLLGNRPGRAVVSFGANLTIGQSACDLSFPDDPALATRHCELSPAPSGAMLRDLSGGLGTFVRLSGAEHPLGPGDRIRIGEQLLQVDAAA